METIRKELTCSECGKKAVVRVSVENAGTHRWHCPHCHKLVTSDQAAVAAASAAAQE
jgi:transposase-like protein